MKKTQLLATVLISTNLIMSTGVTAHATTLGEVTLLSHLMANWKTNGAPGNSGNAPGHNKGSYSSSDSDTDYSNISSYYPGNSAFGHCHQNNGDQSNDEDEDYDPNAYYAQNGSNGKGQHKGTAWNPGKHKGWQENHDSEDDRDDYADDQNDDWNDNWNDDQNDGWNDNWDDDQNDGWNDDWDDDQHDGWNDNWDDDQHDGWNDNWDDDWNDDNRDQSSTTEDPIGQLRRGLKWHSEGQADGPVTNYQQPKNDPVSININKKRDGNWGTQKADTWQTSDGDTFQTKFVVGQENVYGWIDGVATNQYYPSGEGYKLTVGSKTYTINFVTQKANAGNGFINIYDERSRFEPSADHAHSFSIQLVDDQTGKIYYIKHGATFYETKDGEDQIAFGIPIAALKNDGPLSSKSTTWNFNNSNINDGKGITINGSSTGPFFLLATAVICVMMGRRVILFHRKKEK